MRNKIFRKYSETLKQDDAREFTKRVSKMTDTDKQMLANNLLAMMHEVRNKMPKDDNDIPFLQDGGTTVPTRNKLFDTSSIFTPVIDGQEVTYDGLIPVEQKAYVVSDESNRVSPSSTPRPAPSQVLGVRRPGEVDKVAEPEPIPEERAVNLRPVVGAANEFLDPSNNRFYSKDTKTGNYAEIEYKEPGTSLFREDYTQAPKGNYINLTREYTQGLTPVDVQGLSKDIFKDTSTNRYFERRNIIGDYREIGFRGNLAGIDPIEQLPLTRGYFSPGSTSDAKDLSSEVVNRLQDTGKIFNSGKVFFDPQTQAYVMRDPNTLKYVRVAASTLGINTDNFTPNNSITNLNRFGE